MDDKLIQFLGTVYENGYGLIAKKIMKDPNLNIHSKAIYAYLCSYAGNKLTSFPGTKLIQFELGISKDTFYKYLKELIENGYIAVTQERKQKGKFGHNVYSILTVPCPKLPDTVQPYPVESDTNNNNTNINNKNKENNPIWVYQQNIFPTPGKIDVDAITNWTKQLGADLVIYAIELAAKNNVRRLTYIEKILIDWDIHAVKTVDQAKAYTTKKSKEREKGGSSKCNASNKQNKNAGAERANNYDFSDL